MTFSFSLPIPVLRLIERLEQAGHEAFAVGGCVRDLIRGTSPDDFDLTTSALPHEISEIFSDCTVIETGIKHGTVTVLFDETPYEITTYRTDGIYIDGRHPDSVSFSRSLTDDLARRDFTINAMAYAPSVGLVDPFDGRGDLSRGIIRSVGDPSRRFTEDALRILRAVRFASRLGFTIEADTAAAMVALEARLTLVSPERITSELFKALNGDHFEEVLLSYPTVFCRIIPELKPLIAYDQNNPHHLYDLLTHSAKTVSALPRDAVLRLAGLLHDIGKPVSKSLDAAGISHYYQHAAIGADLARDILTRLRLRNTDIHRVTTLLRYHDGVTEESESAVKRRLNKLGTSLFFDLLTLQRADRIAQKGNPTASASHIDLLFQIANTVISKKECFSVASLAVNGYDMIRLGFIGKEIGEALAFLLEAVVDGKVKNEHEELLRYLISRKKT